MQINNNKQGIWGKKLGIMLFFLLFFINFGNFQIRAKMEINMLKKWKPEANIKA